jgi:hypothetical protein
MALNRHFRRHFVVVCARNSAISRGRYQQARMIPANTRPPLGGVEHRAKIDLGFGKSLSAAARVAMMASSAASGARPHRYFGPRPADERGIGHDIPLH